MIDLDGVTVAFDTVTAVEGVDLGVESGEFVTVVGPSGCGKTTLLRVIGGLVEPTDGTVTVGSAPPAERRDDGDIGYVFQEHTLFPWKTALENVRFLRRMAGKEPKPDRARRLLETVGLSEFADAYPRELSSGMKQRVAIVRSPPSKRRCPFPLADGTFIWRSSLLAGDERRRLVPTAGVHGRKPLRTVYGRQPPSRSRALGRCLAPPRPVGRRRGVRRRRGDDLRPRLSRSRHPGADEAVPPRPRPPGVWQGTALGSHRPVGRRGRPERAVARRRGRALRDRTRGRGRGRTGERGVERGSIPDARRSLRRAVGLGARRRPRGRAVRDSPARRTRHRGRLEARRHRRGRRRLPVRQVALDGRDAGRRRRRPRVRGDRGGVGRRPAGSAARAVPGPPALFERLPRLRRRGRTRGADRRPLL
ncbi:ATP-binding cassette domain-containing protein [Natronomonas gomsonensis]|nr:ATP-binding cassette domain-containing protein [Natronomonas gomsonensis]